MNIKAYLMQVPNKGIGYGTIIGYKDQDLPRVSFNYLGQFEAAPSTRARNSGKNRRWYLTDGIVGDERAEKAFDGDFIAVNGHCMKGQIQFNITSRLNSDTTTQLANSFKSKLEDIICDCIATKPLIEIDYSNDFEHPFVLLNADANNILFVLPPGGGGAESYFNNIVSHLSAYKLVLFNNYYHNLKVKNLEKGLSFEALARLYIKYIKLIQSNGPYNFLGWSFGGVLSFEISRQLNNAGDRIANIFMIDSYFNTNKASFEIGKMHEVNIIAEINHSYLPQIDNEAFGLNIANMNINIVLFKANKVNKDELLRDQLELSKYYVNSTFNCLDTLVNHKCIRVIEMHDESHSSWVSNKEQIANICNYLASVLK
jgi:N-(5-amino-5-carboxypentanoyl)-L-cysteinyl-D-valine synthase